MAAITGAVIGAASVANAAYQGSKARSDAKKANAANQAAIKEGQDLQKSQFESVRSDLAPYREAGAAGVPLLTEFNTNPQAQYDYLQSNPIFQASLNYRDRESAGLAARQGRVGTGDFSAQLQENYLLAASPLIQRREQQLLNLAQVGGNAAAQTGQFGAQAVGAINNLGIQGANSNAAMLAARTQNRQQTANNVLGGLSALTGAIGAVRTPPPSAGV